MVDMTEEALYRLSCRAARELLSGLDQGDLEGVSRKLGAIRHYVALAETVPAAQLRGEALSRREQMEMLAGATEGLAGALRVVRDELDSVRTNRALVEHLVSRQAPGRRFPAAGCT